MKLTAETQLFVTDMQARRWSTIRTASASASPFVVEDRARRFYAQVVRDGSKLNLRHVDRRRVFSQDALRQAACEMRWSANRGCRTTSKPCTATGRPPKMRRRLSDRRALRSRADGVRAPSSPPMHPETSSCTRGVT
jgi:hypothetical protein